MSGEAFLYNMVRIIAGTLLYVGQGKIEPEEVGTIMNLTRERIRQVEMRALQKLRQNSTQYNVQSISFLSDR